MRLCHWIIALLPCIASAAELVVDIEGLEEELARAARAGLTLEQYVGRDATAVQIRRLFATADEEIRNSLEPYGYYNATVDGDLEGTERGFRALFRVSAGEPVIVRESRVEVLGDGARIRAVRRAVRNFEPERGDRLDHAEYEKSKQAVETALTSVGYLRAEAIRHRVEVSRKANSATVEVLWQSGPRFRFGPVRFQEAQFPPEFLQRFVPWEPGEYYSSDQLLTLQQRMVDADYFSSVIVQPELESAEGDIVPIDVALVPAKRSVYTAGLYVSTDTGPGAHVGLERRWVNRRGHRLQTDLEYAQRLQAASLGYRIPLPGPNERSYNLGATYRDEDTDTSQSRMLRLVGNEARQWRGFTRSLGFQYIAGDFEVADERRYSTLLFAEGALTKRRADDLSFPRRGYSLTIGTRLAPEGLLSDTSFSQLTFDTKWIRATARRQRVLLRTSLGAMAVDDFNQLPPELRFFAGGDRSVRGFDYQALGTTNAAGQVIGGEFLAVASAEYERYFLPSWGAAVFVDAGDAFRSGEFDLNVGAGLGVRWRSPVGVVRVDFAKPLMSDLADEFRIHVAIGPDL